jgi:CheY-like chemotaxis protein
MGRKKILLVDDCGTSLLFLELLLRGPDYEIVKARDGTQALDRIAVERPDLVLMDLVMPDLSGLDVVRALREREETRGIPVVVVTVRGDAHSRDEAMRIGCQDYLTKPVTAAELRARLERHLGA